MKLLALSALVFVALATTDIARAQAPQMPPPVKEHQWLQQFVGDWDSEAEIVMEPGKPPMKMKSKDVARMVGGFWVVIEGKGEAMGAPFHSYLTLGYDSDKKKYVGTWIDSMTSILWKYEGTVDAAGKTLTLETEGPCHLNPGKLSKFREITEFKSNDHRVFTSNVLGADGKWTTLITVNSRRSK
jgi:hypothetical protein